MVTAWDNAKDYIHIFQKIYNAGRSAKQRINLVEFFESKEYRDK